MHSLHPAAAMIVNHERIFLYVVGTGEKSGFGSFTMNLVLMALYYHDSHGRVGESGKSTSRKLIVDESNCYFYRFNETHGVYKGYFETTFPLISLHNDYDKIRQQVQLDHEAEDQDKRNKKNESTLISTDTKGSLSWDTSRDEFWNFIQSKWYTKGKSSNGGGGRGGNAKGTNRWDEPSFTKESLEDPIVKVSQHPNAMLQKSFVPARHVALDYYNLPTGAGNAAAGDGHQQAQRERLLILFYRMSKYLCESIRINSSIQRVIDKIIEHARIPIRSSEDSSPSISVGFHIRRGDKITSGESRYYKTSEYVDTLVKKMILPNSIDRSTIRTCYVATDENDSMRRQDIMDELLGSLRSANIPCQLHSVLGSTLKKRQQVYDTIQSLLSPTTAAMSTRPINADQLNQPSIQSKFHRSGYDFIVFLTELQLLISADYFIGTFNSNVGGLVALYRGCHRHQDYDFENGDDRGSSNQYGWRDSYPPFLKHGRNSIIDTKFDHYFNSYGVDMEDWFIK